MTNYEKYRSEIEKFTCLGITFGFNKVTEEFDTCYNIKCRSCMFFDIGNCINNKMKWAYSEYIDKPEETDCSKVTVDTPILVRNSTDSDWYYRHFAKYENGKVYAWHDGLTSFTIYNNDFVAWWLYAKLAEVDNGI
jgi:hypothetical protein